MKGEAHISIDMKGKPEVFIQRCECIMGELGFTFHGTPFCRKCGKGWVLPQDSLEDVCLKKS